MLNVFNITCKILISAKNTICFYKLTNIIICNYVAFTCIVKY